MNDYYDILGVERNATPEQIKAAYRRCAMKHHPDRNPGNPEAEARFKQCQAAYDVLGNVSKRQAYDRSGVDPFAGGFDAGSGGLDDLFESIFSNFGGRPRTQKAQANRGEDISLRVPMNLEEAILGKSERIKYKVRVACQPCQATGSKTGKTVQCQTCQGSGQIRAQRGIFVMASTCNNCSGRGKTAEDPCNECQGAGTVVGSREMDVQIPSGVDNGDRIRLTGHGHHGIPEGDLYLEIVVHPHPSIQRDGLDLHTQVNVRASMAALGGKVEVSSPYGQLIVGIPEGTQPGAILRLKGKGVKSSVRKATGDMLCHVVIQTPVNLTRKQRKILEELEKSFKN